MARYAAAREKTHEKIKTALIELLQHKDYPDITVREIASQAGIGFKTFYRHYDDKSVIANELYVDIWTQLLKQIREIGLSTHPEEVLHHLITTVQKNAPLMRAFVVLGSYQEILPEFTIAFAQEQIREYRPDLFGSNNPHAKSLQSIVATYFMTGQIELIRWWLVQDEMKLPVEGLVSMMLQLVVQPIMELKLPDLPDKMAEK